MPMANERSLKRRTPWTRKDGHDVLENMSAKRAGRPVTTLSEPDPSVAAREPNLVQVPENRDVRTLSEQVYRVASTMASTQRLIVHVPANCSLPTDFELPVAKIEELAVSVLHQTHLQRHLPLPPMLLDGNHTPQLLDHVGDLLQENGKLFSHYWYWLQVQSLRMSFEFMQSEPSPSDLALTMPETC